MSTPTFAVGSRRRCDNCPKYYTVLKPDHRFCSTRCRKEFHRFGTPLLRLRPIMNKEIERAAEQTEFRIFTALDQPTAQRYRKLYPTQARRFDAMTREAEAESASQAS